MLTYLINVTNDMLALSLLIGMMMAFLDTYCKNSGKIVARIGLGAGIIIAGVRAYFTNTRRIKNGWMIGRQKDGPGLADLPGHTAPLLPSVGCVLCAETLK